LRLKKGLLKKRASQINESRDSISKLCKAHSNIQKLLSDFFCPEILLDPDNLNFEEYSDVSKKLNLYTSTSPMDKKKDNQSLVTSAADLMAGPLSKAKKKIILVTDDSYYNRKTVSEMINRKNMKTMEAINGQDAVVKVQNSFDKDSDIEIQLILMDLEMPIMGGIEATIEIRKLEKRNNKKWVIPIVALTAHNSANHKNNCFKAGMQEHVVKPVTSNILKAILEKYTTNLLKEASIVDGNN